MRMHANDNVVRQVELGNHITAVSLPASPEVPHGQVLIIYFRSYGRPKICIRPFYCK